MAYLGDYQCYVTKDCEIEEADRHLTARYIRCLSHNVSASSQYVVGLASVALCNQFK